MSWRKHFPKHEVPKPIQDLVDAGLLKDETTARDAQPRLEARFPDGSELVVWVEHKDPKRRFWRRFDVRLHEPGQLPATRLETDDVDEALAAIRQVFEEKGGPRRLP